MDLKGSLADHIGHFSPYDIPGLIFMVLAAALITWLVAVLGARMRGTGPRLLALWSASAALGVAFVKMQLPLAIALVAISVLVRPTLNGTRDRVLVFGSLVIGLGCGSGASLIMAIAAVPYLLLVRWAFVAMPHGSTDE